MFSRFLAFAGDNAQALDEAGAEAALRKSNPDLLLADEKVIWAFQDRGGAGRDSKYFTSKRILIQDVQGMSGKIVHFLSVPYMSIKAFSIQTTGGGLDTDCTLKIWSTGVGNLSMDFAKGTDIVGIGRHFNEMVLVEGNTGADVPYTYKQGDKAFYLSDSRQNWFDCLVIAIEPTGGIQVNIEGSQRTVPFEQVATHLKPFAQFCQHPGYISGGGDLLTEKMTVDEAKRKAALLPGCVGFTHEGGPTSSPVTIHFKNKFDCHAGAWTSYRKEARPKASSSDGGQAPEIPIDAGKGGKIDSFLDKMGQDYRQIDARQCEEQFKQEPQILMSDEFVEMAFQCGRDMFLLTSKRILQVDVQGWSGKRVEYVSILWKYLRGFSIETAGSYDRDVDMTIFTDIRAMPRIRQDFRKGTCDVTAIQKFFTDKLLGQDSVPTSAHAASMEGHKESGPAGWLAWMGDDCRMIDAAQADKEYHTNPAILQNSEHVEMAFKGRRDITVFTTKRLLIIDFKGWSSKKVNYISIPWTTVQAFGVRSAGSFMDKDSEMLIFTDINDVQIGHDNPPEPGVSYFELDFQKDKVDLMAINRYLSARCLQLAGGGYLSPEVPVSPELMKPSPPDTAEKILNWLGEDARTIDPNALDQELHKDSMLQSDEHVVMAFKVYRDTLMFTTKRVFIIDVQGWSGKKVQYTSIPYTSIRAFSVESAGSWDTDAEVKLWIKTYWYNGPNSIVRQDLRKGKADIVAIQSFLAAQVIGAEDGSTTSPMLHGAPPDAPGGINGFLHWIGDDAHEIDAASVNEALHKSPPLLQSDEKAELCFKVGRDMIVLTTKRVLKVDVQGWSGKKVEYMSYPLKYLHAFAVKSAGSSGFLNSANVSFYTDIAGAECYSQDLAKNNGANIWAVQTMMAKKLLLGAEGGSAAGKGGYPA